MLQNVLAEEQWAGLLGPRRPGVLFWQHLQPWCEVRLNMESRLSIGGRCADHALAATDTYRTRPPGEIGARHGRSVTFCTSCASLSLVTNDVVDQYVSEAAAALRGLATDHSPAELRRRIELAQRQEWTCTWCGQPLRPADIGGGRTQVDHVIPLIRGGPHASWNTELLHSGCNGAKGQRMTARAWDLARQRGVCVVPPDPGALRNAVDAVAAGLRRIGVVLADFQAGLEIPVDDELDDLLTDVHATAYRIANSRHVPVSDNNRSP
jgi:HNH endonuclease